MANQPNQHFETILEKLLSGWHGKAIAAWLDIPYETVMTIKRRYCKTITVLKDHVPDAKQGNFFSNFWRSDR